MVNMKIFQQYDQYEFEAMHHSHLEQSTDLENDLRLIQQEVLNLKSRTSRWPETTLYSSVTSQ